MKICYGDDLIFRPVESCWQPTRDPFARPLGKLHYEQPVNHGALEMVTPIFSSRKVQR